MYIFSFGLQGILHHTSPTLSLLIIIPFLCCFAIVEKRAILLSTAMDDSSASYIHMVQHLIEKCLIFHMTKEECMAALSKHANIKPVITSTVWNELEKENREFFEAYSRAKSNEDRMSEAETSQMIQNMISGDSSKGSND